MKRLTYGGESYYYGIVKTLSDLGHEVHLFAPGGSERPKNGFLYYIHSTKDGSINYAIEDWVEKKYHDILMSMDIIHDCSLDHITAERLRFDFSHDKKMTDEEIKKVVTWVLSLK